MMIIYTNESNLLGLKLLIGTKLAGKPATVTTVNLEGKIFRKAKNTFFFNF
jgi:hypothetical protein